MSYAPAAEFRQLYDAFTGRTESIGAHLNGQLGQRSDHRPLLVTTGSDMVLFPGDGRAPVSESFRNSTRGFVELTAVSHIGVAVPYLARLHELGFEAWRSDAQTLLSTMAAVRAVNTPAYWRDVVAAEAFKGLEAKIVDMVDYSCGVGSAYVREALDRPERFTVDAVRERLLDPAPSPALPVPLNDMMAATFALVFLDTGYRVMRWLGAQAIDWPELMIMLTGQVGRPTAGLTWKSNSMCHLLWRASGEALRPEHLLIAPSAPALTLADLASADGARALEGRFRQIWYSARATAEMGARMYEGYPAFRPRLEMSPVVGAETDVLAELPKVTSAQDRRAIMTRLRFVMEDPGQQLANAQAQFIVDQLADNGNRPAAVVVPGFTGVAYPPKATSQG